MYENCYPCIKLHLDMKCVLAIVQNGWLNLNDLCLHFGKLIDAIQVRITLSLDNNYSTIGYLSREMQRRYEKVQN